MKEVIFSEDQLNNLDVIGKDLFNDEKDPRSSAYIRYLKRPKISWCKIILSVIIPIIGIIVLIVLFKKLAFSTPAIIVDVTLFFVLYIFLMLKRAVVCAVKVYQRYAPDTIRNRCRYEPSCSEYMILSIEKYGLINGLNKGINRLKRCNVDGGGFDYP